MTGRQENDGERGFREGDDLLAMWAAAQGEGGASKMELGLSIVAALLGRWQLDDAARVLQEIEGLSGDASALSAAIVLRQLLRSARQEPLDVAALDGALPVLISSGRWAHALDASGLLAGQASELGQIRLYRAMAIGCAEAAGAIYRGAVQLRLLAAAELEHGEHTRCLAHLERALARLEGVALIGARLEQARCHELAGDALRLVGDAASARARYEQAIERFTHPDLGARHRERVEAKLR